MHNFLHTLSGILNSGQTRSAVLSGNIYDLFYDGEKYVPLVDFISNRTQIKSTGTRKGVTQVIYELNSDIRIVGDKDELARAWKETNPERYDLDKCCHEANGSPTFAMEFLRQLTICSRRHARRLSNDLLVVVEGADMILPEDQINRMSIADRRRVHIVHDWFTDPEFLNAHDSVVLLTESRSQIHSRIARLPQIIEVEVPLPDLEERKQFIANSGISCSTPGNLSEITAGLSLHAIRQLLCRGTVVHDDVIDKVAEYVTAQLGDGVVEFSKPSHTFEDVLGFRRIKDFMQNEIIPRFHAGKDAALPGAAVSGPIGGGKTFICEALAAELGLPVLVLKNLRSKWFGETDIIFERLRRTLTAFHKIVIFVDEADTQFGGVGEGTHETERRLTGKLQAMMSDTRLRGKVLWLLMTARIHQLSPDIRRPGRVGDLIIPILDPEGEDRTEFVNWILRSANIELNDHEARAVVDNMTVGYSAASFAALRSQIKAKGCSDLTCLNDICHDMIPPDIGDARQYQRLQALLNCTRRSLLPTPNCDLDQERRQWRAQIDQLEKQGIG